MGELRCLEVGTKDRKVAMQAAHVNNGSSQAFVFVNYLFNSIYVIMFR